VLIVTHRLARVRQADRRYVLHGGRVTEQGTHAELLARRGRYAERCLVQASQDEAAPYYLWTDSECRLPLRCAPRLRRDIRWPAISRITARPVRHAASMPGRPGPVLPAGHLLFAIVRPICDDSVTACWRAFAGPGDLCRRAVSRGCTPRDNAALDSTGLASAVGIVTGAEPGIGGHPRGSGMQPAPIVSAPRGAVITCASRVRAERRASRKSDVIGRDDIGRIADVALHRHGRINPPRSNAGRSCMCRSASLIPTTSAAPSTRSSGAAGRAGAVLRAKRGAAAAAS
jgi:hypothetical protein